MSKKTEEGLTEAHCNAKTALWDGEFNVTTLEEKKILEHMHVKIDGISVLRYFMLVTF